MAGTHHRLVQGLLAAVFAAVVAPQRVAGAQDADDESEQVGAVPGAANATNGLFDRLVFGGVKIKDLRNQFEATLTTRITSLEWAYDLTEAQKAKLRLAGHGDIKRWFDFIEDKKRESDQISGDPEMIRAYSRRLKAFRTRLRHAPFGEDSIFSKTFKTMLKPVERAEYEKALCVKRGERHVNLINKLINSNDHPLNLNEEQRRRFRNVLLRKTPPPRLDALPDCRVLLLQTSQLPDTELRPIFDKPQWEVLKKSVIKLKEIEYLFKDAGMLE
jgi:hypothetical protein